MTILCIQHNVRGFDRWKASFDADPLDRKGSGVRRYRIVRASDDPNFVMIDLEFETTAQAEHMLSSLQDMWPRRMGVIIDDPKGRVFDVTETAAPPPGQEQHMTIIHIEHTVRDYDAWKAAFDADPMDRKGSGVRRYRIARATDNPDLVRIDLELETKAEAEAMLASLQEMWQGLEGMFVDGPTGRIFDVAEAQEV